jgi:hypothetical protein
VWSAVVDAFPQHEGCVLVGMFTSTAVVRHPSVLILIAVVIYCVVFAQTQLNLYENTRIFVAVNAVIQPVHFRLFPALFFFFEFQFQSLRMVVATEPFALGSLLSVGVLFLFFPLFHVVSFFSLHLKAILAWSLVGSESQMLFLVLRSHDKKNGNTSAPLHPKPREPRTHMDHANSRSKWSHWNAKPSEYD